MKKIRVNVGDKSYEVTVEMLEEGSTQSPSPSGHSAASTVVPHAASVPAPPVSAVVRPTAAAGAGRGDVVSPLGGKIVSVEVKTGTQVAEGDLLLIVEAMKMNTYVHAPVSGTVSEILAVPGEGVDEGTLLLRIS